MKKLVWHFLFSLFRFWAISINFRFLIFSGLCQTFENSTLGLSEGETLADSGEKIVRLSQVEPILEPTTPTTPTSGMRPATLLKKRPWHSCFPVNFVKFLRAPFFKKHLQWLLLHMSRKRTVLQNFLHIHRKIHVLSFYLKRIHSWIFPK